MHWRIGTRRAAVIGTFAVALVGSIQTAAAAPQGRVAYYMEWGYGLFDAILIDWNTPNRVRLVNGSGAQLGTAARVATQTTIALDAPISKLQIDGSLDSCGMQPTQRRDTTGFIVRDIAGDANRGRSQVVELGTLTNVDGCDVGLVTPFGAAADVGTTMKRLAMAERPPSKDLVPGTVLAGLGELEWPVDYDYFWETDLVTLYAGNLALFGRSGHVVPAEFNGDKWLVLGLPQGQRAFTRLEIDDETGAEAWMRAEWSGGLPQRVITDLVVKTDTKAGFGTERQASRIWEIGLFYKLQDKSQFRLYLGGTGERLDLYLSEGSVTHIPITWGFVGKNIVIRRLVGAGPTQRERTWIPLRNGGDRVRFVMESENNIYSDGSVRPFIPPRVNFFIDRGRAVAP